MNVSIIESPDFGVIRSQVIKGEPWFVAKDVCDAFGDSHYRRTLAELDPDERVLHKIDTLGGMQEMVLINESGIYHLLFLYQPLKGNNKELATQRSEFLKKFRKWVTSDVLPSLRKYGKYVVAGSREEFREQAKVDKRLEKQMLTEISRHLTCTDEGMIASKLKTTTGKVSSVLLGFSQDVTILVECIDRASKNSKAKKLLSSNTVRRQIIDMLRGGDIQPLMLES